MAQDQEQLMKVFGSLMAGKKEEPDSQAEYYKQREKYDKRRMISSIVAPIAGQFLGQLVAAPFREPVHDFLRTQEGMELYGQWKDHDKLKKEVINATEDLKQFEGGESEYFYNRAKTAADPIMEGELNKDWFKDSIGPDKNPITGEPIKRASNLRGIYTNYENALRKTAKIEQQQYHTALEYYKNFPDEKKFLENVERYGPRSSNFGQALFRKLKRAFMGQSKQEYIDESIFNIMGVNAEIFRQKVKENPDDDRWGMDTGTFNEMIAEATAPVTPEVVARIAQDAIEQYWDTPTGQIRNIKARIKLNDETERANLWQLYQEGEKLSPGFRNIYERILSERKDDDPLPSILMVEQDMRDMLKLKKEDRPSIESLRNNIIGQTRFNDFMRGTEGRPGLNRSMWARHYPSLPWQVEQNTVEATMSYWENQGKFSSTDRTAFYTSRNMTIDEVAKAARAALPFVLSELSKEVGGKNMPEELYDDLVSADFQENMTSELMLYMTKNHIERKEGVEYRTQLWESWRGKAPVLVANMITGLLKPSIEDMKKFTRMALDETNLKRESFDVDQDVDQDVALKDKTEIVNPYESIKVNNAQDQINFARGFPAKLQKYITDLPGDADHAEAVTNLLNTLNPDQVNIFGTEAMNHTMLPLYIKALQNDKEGNPLILPLPGTKLYVKLTPQTRQHQSEVLKSVVENAGGSFLQFTIGKKEELAEDKIFVLGKEPEELSLLRGVSEDIIPSENTEARKAIANYKNLPIEVQDHLAIMSSRYVPLIMELNELEKDSDVSPIAGREEYEEYRDQVFPLHKKTQEEWKAEQRFLALPWAKRGKVQKERESISKRRGEVITIGEYYAFKDSEETDERDIISGVRWWAAEGELGPDQYVETGGQYKGDTYEEKRINKLKASIDIMIRSIGVPGIDMKGEQPIAHNLLIEAYDANFGTSKKPIEEVPALLDDKEASLLVDPEKGDEPSNAFTLGNALLVDPEKGDEDLEPTDLSAIPKKGDEPSLLVDPEKGDEDLEPIDLRKIPEKKSLPESPLFNQMWEITSEFEGGEYFTETVGNIKEINNSGLTLKTYQNIQRKKGLRIPTKDDLKALSYNQVREIIRGEFYEDPELYKLPEELQGVVFDHSLMRGSVNAIKLLQKTLGYRGKEKVDGRIGELTLETLQNINIPRSVEVYQRARVQEFEKIVKSNKKLDQFINGWTKRVNSYPLYNTQ